MDKLGRKAYRHKFDEVGEAYATYGVQSDISDIDDFIQTQGDTKLSIMMMAAMIKRLGAIRTEIRLLGDLMEQQFRGVEKRDSVADGMLMALRVTGADVPIMLCDQSELSIRAQNALRDGKFQSLAEITEEAVLDLRNCGVSTFRELEDWKRLQYGKFSVSNWVRLGSLDTGEKR